MQSKVSHEIERKKYNFIPKIVMQTWKTEGMSSEWSDCRESLQVSLPSDWQYVFMTDFAMYSFVKFAFPELFDDFLRLPYGVQRADIFRYLWLYAYGGLYLDLDYKIHKPFVHFLEAINSPLIVIYSANMKSVLTNSIIAAKPGLPLLLELAKASLKRPYGRWFSFTKHIQIMTSTGPLAFNDAIKDSNIPYTILPQKLFLSSSPILRDFNTETGFMSATEGGSWNSGDTIFFNFINKYKLFVTVFFSIIILMKVLDAYITKLTLDQLISRLKKSVRKTNSKLIETVRGVISTAEAM